MPAGLIGILVAVGIMLHFIQLARRVVDEKLERWARTILWLNVIGSSIGIVGGTIGMVSMLAAGGAPGSAGATSSGLTLAGMITGGLAGCAGVLASLVAMIWQIVLIFQLRRYFVSAARMGAASQGA